MAFGYRGGFAENLIGDHWIMHLFASDFPAGHSGLNSLFLPCLSPYQAIQPALTTTPHPRPAQTISGHESRPGHWQQSAVNGLPGAAVSGLQGSQKLENCFGSQKPARTALTHGLRP